jgi:transposase InsO family protein
MILPREANVSGQENAEVGTNVLATSRPQKRPPKVTGAAPLQNWALTQKLGEAPTQSSLALGLSPVVGLNGSELAQAKASEQYRRIIQPVLNPEGHPELRGLGRTELIQHIADQTGKKVRTVYRILERWEEQGITGLTRKIRADRGNPRALNDAAKEFIVTAVLPEAGVRGEFSVRETYRVYEEERRWRASHAGKPLSQADRVEYRRYVGSDGCLLASAQLPEASYDTFCREVNRLPDLVKAMARHGEEGYKNGELLSFRDIASTSPLDYVVMDHRVLDIFAMVRTRTGWDLQRPWITCALDMRTRKWLSWCFVSVPSSDSIATVLRKLFVNWGLPKAVLWDNGKDFRSHWLEGRREKIEGAKPADGLPEKWAGVLETLNIRVHHAIVRRSRSKLIEPAFGAIADFDRTLPEWCGHKPGARPERFEQMLKEHEAWIAGKRSEPVFRTIEQVTELYSRKIEDLNETPHTGDGMRKVTPTGLGWACPNEVWELNIPRVERRTVPEEVLQLCFAKRRELTVRNGEVQTTFGNQPYHYRLSENRLALLALNGKKVELAYDTLDLSKAAVYYEGAFIGLADNAELRRMGEADFVEDERDRRRTRREVKDVIKRLHQSVPVPDAEKHLARRAEVLPTRTEPARPEATATIPAAIEAAAKAVAEEKAFSFADARAEMDSIEAPPPVAEDDCEFHFFSDQGD